MAGWFSVYLVVLFSHKIRLQVKQGAVADAYDDNSLCRFEWMEALIRMAVARIMDTQEAE
jgi:hypothetical protein